MTVLFTASITTTLENLVAIGKLSHTTVDSTNRINPDMPLVAKDVHVKNSYRRQEGAPNHREFILDLIRQNGQMSTGDIRKAFVADGRLATSVDGSLSYLKLHGRLVQGKDGLWRLP